MSGIKRHMYMLVENSHKSHKKFVQKVVDVSIFG